MAEIILAEGAAASTPSTNTVTLYAKTDGLLYSKDDAGTETPLGVSGGGQASLQFKDEGSNLGTSGTAISVDFVGSGVTATRSVNDITVTIPGGSGSPGGSSTQLQYNNAGAFGGIAGATSDGTNTSFKDANLKITDDADTTKVIQFEASSITTGTTRTLTVPDVSMTLTGTTNTATLQNKTLDDTNILTIKDTNLTIEDDADTTKKVKFQVSSVSTGTTRTYTFPDSTDTFVLLAATQTLQNKTLDNTSTVTLKDTNFTLQDDGDTTKQAKFQLSGITTGTTRTFTVPDTSDTLVTLAATQTLQNKTLNDTNTITVKDANFTVEDDADTTKKLALQLSGITTATTRTVTIPDASGTLLYDPAGNGIVVRTSSGVTTSRTLTGTSNKITITNGDGVAGNPTFTTGSLVVHTDQSNTYSTGAQDFGSATSVKVPTSGGAAPASDGLIGYDSTKDSWAYGINSSTVYGSYTLNVQRNGDTNNSSSGSGADYNHTLTYSIPAGLINYAGRVIRVTQFWYASTGSAAPSLFYKLKLGSGPTTIFAVGTASSPTSSISNRSVILQYILITDTTGASGTVMCTCITPPAGNSSLIAGSSNSIAQPVGTFDLTAAQTLTHSTQWTSAGTGTNTIQLLAAMVELLN